MPNGATANASADEAQDMISFCNVPSLALLFGAFFCVLARHASSQLT
jgi:hypothetical protein